MVIIVTWGSPQLFLGPKVCAQSFVGCIVRRMEKRPGPVLGSPGLDDRGPAHNLYSVYPISVATAVGLQRRESSGGCLEEEAA